MGVNPLTILGMLDGGGMQSTQVQQAPAQRPPADDRMAAFVSTVLADTEDVWTAVFAKGDGTYTAPRLVLFRGATATACGQGEAAMGPFLLPGVWAHHAQRPAPALVQGRSASRCDEKLRHIRHPQALMQALTQPWQRPMADNAGLPQCVGAPCYRMDSTNLAMPYRLEYRTEFL